MGLLPERGGEPEDKGLTEGITITSHYEDRNGEPYQTEWAINPLLLEGSGYSALDRYGHEVSSSKPPNIPVRPKFAESAFHASGE